MGDPLHISLRQGNGHRRINPTLGLKRSIP